MLYGAFENPLKSYFCKRRNSVLKTRISLGHKDCIILESWLQGLEHVRLWMWAGTSPIFLYSNRGEIAFLKEQKENNTNLLSCFEQLDIESEVNNEMANRMSLFYAEATPVLKTLSNATTHFVVEVSKTFNPFRKLKIKSEV